MKKYLKILKKCPLFEGIDEDKLLIMLPCLGARVMSFDKKYTVFTEGTPAKNIGILLSGEAHIIRNDYYGNRSIIGRIEPADIFGEAFACAEIKSLPISVICEEPSEVMLIDCSHILHTCQNNCGFHQQLIYNLMRDLAKKNLSSYRKIEVTSKRSTREKLLAYLAIAAEEANSSSFTIPFDRQELADYLEVDRSGLSQEISKLTREGVLSAKKSTFHLY